MNAARPLRTLIAMAVAAAFASPVHAATEPSPVALPFDQPDKSDAPRFDRGTVLVRFEAGVTTGARPGVVSAHGMKLGVQIRRTNFFVVSTNGRDPRAALRDLRSAPEVAQAQLNYIREAHITPDDPLYPGYQKKYMVNGRFPQAWDVTQGSTSVNVAIVDTGVDLTHPDLDGARLKAGWDFVNEDNNPRDDNGHGTFVAGAAAAITDNGVGVAGAAWKGGIIPVKVLGANGFGTDVDVAEGITWAADNGADVINLSLGGPGSSQVLEDAVNYALAQDVLVVASAGNEGGSAPSYPAALEGVLAVSATDRSGSFAYFSNWGWWVDISAPGMFITSTYWFGGEHLYATGQGTSFAGPLVAGAALLVRYQHPSWTQAAVADELLSTAQDRGPAGADPFYGRGWLDAYAALGGAEKNPADVPAQDSLEPDGTVNRANLLTGITSTPTISPEGDQDWFKTTVDVTGSITYTVTPKPPDPLGDRTLEMDAVLEVYGPDYSLLGTMDATFFGEPEEITVPVDTIGTYYLHVVNYHGSRSSETYTVEVESSDQSIPHEMSEPDLYEINAQPTSLELADVTDDGLTDVLMSTGYYQGPDYFKLYVYPQQLDGNLGSPVIYPLDGGAFGDPATLDLGDLDGDGKADAAVGVAPGLDLFYQSGGVFVGPTLVPLSEEPIDVEIADIDGDTRNDIVVVTSTSTLLLANTESGFVESTLLSEAAYPGLHIADMTSDGLPDLVSLAGALGSTVNVYVQEPGGTFLETNYSQEADGISVGDVTADGLDDVAVTSNESGWRVAVLAQLPTGGLDAPVLYDVEPNAGLVLAADLTRDGLGDVTVLHSGDLMSVLEQQGDGSLGEPTLYETPDILGWLNLTAGDVTGDGDDDLLLLSDQSGSTERQLRVYEELAFQGGLVWVRNTSPPDFQTGVVRDKNVTVTFGRDVDPASISSATAYVMRGDTWVDVPVTLIYDQVARKLTFDKALNYGKNKPYVIFVDGVEDLDGNAMPLFTFRFTTKST